MEVWMDFEDLLWSSDWSGDEVGFEESNIVGLYSVKDSDIDLYIDMETMKILQIFCNNEHLSE